MALEASGQILVTDASAGTGFLGALFRVDPTTGNRTVLSDFGDSAKGDLGVTPFGVAVVPASTVQDDLEDIAAEIAATMAANPGSADKLEDVLAKVQAAIAKLDQTPPDRQGALGELEGAVGDLAAAVNDGLLSAAQGNDLMNRIAGAARRLAAEAIAEAKARGGDAGKIAAAEQALFQGDAQRALGQFKDAVGRYKEAVSNAEGA